jgi:hypothetical protein
VREKREKEEEEEKGRKRRGEENGFCSNMLYQRLSLYHIWPLKKNSFCLFSAMHVWAYLMVAEDCCTALPGGDGANDLSEWRGGGRGGVGLLLWRWRDEGGLYSLIGLGSWANNCCGAPAHRESNAV